MSQNHLKYNQDCSPLLHYRSAYRANSCGNAIAKPLAFYCSPLLCYRFVSTTLTAQIPNGNAIAKPQALLHTGKERDSETGFSYFGARYYDSDLMTGWLSVDPMADKYPSLSPYAYCGWNPVKLVDPDGREIIIHNMEWAKKIANDLNAIYKATYNIDQDAFAVQQVKDRKGNVYNRLVANKEFNWNLDKYTKAMKECIDDPEKVTIKVVKNENPDGPTLSRGRKVKDFIRDLGGGMIDRKTVYISEKLPTYSKDNGTQGKFAKNHCLGGIVMHELLYHLHNVGETDIYNSKETPTIMQSYYKIKRSNEHPAGVNQVFPSNKKRK